MTEQHRIAHGQLGLYVGRNPRRKLHCPARVERNGQHPRNMHPWKAAIHSALFSPTQHPVTRPYSTLGQQRRKPPRQPRQLP